MPVRLDLRDSYFYNFPVQPKLILVHKNYLTQVSVILSMDYPIPASIEEVLKLKNTPVNAEIIIKAIAGVIQIARQQGQSLEELTADVLQDDCVLDLERRKWLSDLIAQVWLLLPSLKEQDS